MKAVLRVKPKNPTIIEGFPGFGLVATIVTEYVIKSLDAKLIGEIRMEELPPLVAVHQGHPVQPIGIFYAKKQNLVIIHALNNVKGFEWKVADVIAQIGTDLKAKEIISVEGVGAPGATKKQGVYFMGNNKKLSTMDISPLQEGIIMGVTASLLLKKGLNLSCIFVESQSELPDSRAAAKVIQTLDNYLGLKMDVKPLLKKADEFETKLKGLLAQTKKTQATATKKHQQYFG